MELLYKDLTYKIRKCIFEVQNEIGAGFDEETYHQGLIMSFTNHNLPFLSREKKALLHRGKIVHNFINDFVLFDKIILSVKCVPCEFLRAHYIQLFSELKVWKMKVGQIVNFGLPVIEIERYVYIEKEPNYIENYTYIDNHINNQEKEILAQIVKGIKDVASMHKLGYSRVIWKNIVEAELEYLRLSFTKNNIIPVQFFEKTIRKYRLRHFIVENKIIFGITALQDNINQYDVANMQSYLKELKLSVGLIVNFGKRDVQISGIRARKNIRVSF